MGNVNSDVLAGIRTNFQAIFQKALGDNVNMLIPTAKIATEKTSTSDRNTYSWFGITPPMTEWKDNRKMNGLLPYNYTIVNKRWANGIEVDRDAIEDDLLGQYADRIKGLPRAYFRAVQRDVFSALDGAYANSLKAYDATAFFADTRQIGQSANIDNYLSGNYSDSESEIRTAIYEGMAAMAAYQDDWGEPLNLQPDTIVCSPGMKLLISQALRPGVAGVIRPESEIIKPENIISNAWIKTNAKDWFLLCTTEDIKPLIFQNRKAPEFDALDSPTGEKVFTQNKFMYGCSARYNVGFGDPRTAIMFHNT